MVSAGDPDSKLDDYDRFWGQGDSYRRWIESRLPSVVGDRVEFLSPRDHTQVSRLISDADVLAFPSVWHEPFGLPVVEGMASGLPVVGTHAGALDETVDDGSTGILVDRGAPGQLVGALSRLLGDPDLRESMGRAGRRKAEDEYSWSRNTRAWMQVYQAA